MGRRTDLTAVVAERGQVTIPKSLREKLGLRPGSVVHFVLTEGKLILTKESAADRVKSAVGILKGRTAYTSTDDYIRETRGPAD